MLFIIHRRNVCLCSYACGCLYSTNVIKISEKLECAIHGNYKPVWQCVYHCLLLSFNEKANWIIMVAELVIALK